MTFFLLVAVLLSAADALSLGTGEVCCPKHQKCYNIDPPFLDTPLPQCPDEMAVSMKVYTRQNQNTGDAITREAIPSCFIPGALTIFLMHGWSQNGNYTWLHDAKNALLGKENCNVVIVDWGLGASYYYYPKSAANTRTVGGEIAAVARLLISLGKVTKALLHCVGHSLGAHGCGYAGQQASFGRITGLDPAGPWFEDSSVGLSASCADQVDVMHTNGGNFGLIRPVGHKDFYPNGGTKQPGCASGSAQEVMTWSNYFDRSADQQDYSLQKVIACDHLLACDFFIQSILKDCFVSRYQCPSPPLLSSVLCTTGNVIQSMGFGANKYALRGIFYLKTDATAPYCLG